MAKKNDNGIDILVCIILLGIIGLFFLAKFLFIGLILLIIAVCVWLGAVDKKKGKRAIKTILGNNEIEGEPANKTTHINNISINDMYKKTLVSGEKKKKFKTKDGLDVEIVIEDSNEQIEENEENEEDEEGEIIYKIKFNYKNEDAKKNNKKTSDLETARKLWNDYYYYTSRKIFERQMSEGKLVFGFSTSDYIAKLIIEEIFFKDYEMTKIKNMDENDDSDNYKMTIDNTNWGIIGLLYHMKQEKKISELVYKNIPISRILNLQKPIEDLKENEIWGEEIIKKNLKKVMEELIEKYKSHVGIFEAFTDFYDLNNTLEPDGMHSRQDYHTYACREKKELRKVYQELILELREKNIIKSKWKSEFELYLLVSDMFPETIFQYRDEWLETQSLDIFIPEKNIAIEYQGKQHYEPIDYFGGEENFIHNQERDRIKKEKCRLNNVKLIEWKYDEIINKENLKKKLKENNI